MTLPRVLALLPPSPARKPPIFSNQQGKHHKRIPPCCAKKSIAIWTWNACSLRKADISPFLENLSASAPWDFVCIQEGLVNHPSGVYRDSQFWMITGESPKRAAPCIITTPNFGRLLKRTIVAENHVLASFALKPPLVVLVSTSPPPASAPRHLPMPWMPFLKTSIFSPTPPLDAVCSGVATLILNWPLLGREWGKMLDRVKGPGKRAGIRRCETSSLPTT